MSISHYSDYVNNNRGGLSSEALAVEVASLDGLALVVFFLALPNGNN